MGNAGPRLALVSRQHDAKSQEEPPPNRHYNDLVQSHRFLHSGERTPQVFGGPEVMRLLLLNKRQINSWPVRVWTVTSCAWIRSSAHNFGRCTACVCRWAVCTRIGCNRATTCLRPRLQWPEPDRQQPHTVAQSPPDWLVSMI